VSRPASLIPLSFDRESFSFEALPLVAHGLHNLFSRKATETRNTIDILIVLFGSVDHSAVERLALESWLADGQARCF
jgi:hypothetical protein